MNRRYLLDTGIASDCINRRGSPYEVGRDAVTRGDIVGVCLPVVAELFAGVELSRTREFNLDRLQRSLGAFRIWPFNMAAAEEYGRLFAYLRKVGRPMQQIDIQVAAIALSLRNCTLVSKDRDFLSVPRLEVVDWSISESPD